MDILTFIIGIAVMIFIHELGHFLVARLLGVEVEEFGIGFPPRMVKLFERNGTIYSLNWIPLGGFVRPKGENDPEIPGGLAAANPWVRLAVLAAGSLMNLLTGVVLGVLLFYSLGDPIANKVLISEVSPGSPAEAAGLQIGDLIVEVDGIVVDSIVTLQKVTASNLGEQMTLMVQRDGSSVTVSLTPRKDPPVRPDGLQEGPLGIVLDNPTQPIGFGTAVQRGVRAAYMNAVGILQLPMRMMSGQASPEEGRLVGYKGMFDVYRRLENPLLFFMAISISLGIINLLPIPALDGGRILLTLPEILIRKRVPARYENAIHMIGFALLILLMIYINVQDFINPIQLP